MLGIRDIKEIYCRPLLLSRSSLRQAECLATLLKWDGVGVGGGKEKEENAWTKIGVNISKIILFQRE